MGMHLASRSVLARSASKGFVASTFGIVFHFRESSHLTFDIKRAGPRVLNGRGLRSRYFSKAKSFRNALSKPALLPCLASSRSAVRGMCKNLFLSRWANCLIFC